MKLRGLSSRVLLVTTLTAASLLVACGDDAVSKDDCEVVAPTSSGVTELTITAKNMSYDKSCVQVEPGTLELTFVNEDKSVAHNLRVKGGGLNESTALQSGPFTETLTLDLTEPGDHSFICDPHNNMKGVIVVSDPDATASN